MKCHVIQEGDDTEANLCRGGRQVEAISEVANDDKMIDQ